MNRANPLLDFSQPPRFEDIETTDVTPAVDTLIERNRRAAAALAGHPSRPTWENFAAPLEAMEDDLERAWAPVSHLHAVLDNDALRGVYEKCIAKLSVYRTELGQDSGLYGKFRELADSPGFAALDPARGKAVENVLREFRLSGVDLDAAGKRRVGEIDERLTELGNRFEQNLLDATDAWSMTVTDEQELAGLPRAARAAAREEARRAGEDGWRFTLRGPCYAPFMTHADDRARRRLMHEAHATRASEIGPHGGRFDNSTILTEILGLRREKARLLGFETYAEYSLESKMAPSVAAVESFLTDLAARSLPAARRELDELRAFARDALGGGDLEAWDVAYYSEKLKKHKYHLDEEALRPWFPLPKVLDGMFAVARRLFGVTVRPASGAQLWHRDARFFEVLDRDGALRGQFYVDLYARDRKRGGAWMAECVNRRIRDGVVQTPVAFLTCNFMPPVAGRPSLLTHEEVTTLFHEFGHGLHHLLTRVDCAGVSGINGVEWDAVELPSQFLENWCWERAALELISGHFQTGETLPEETLARLKAARNFQAAMRMVRQLEFALFDLRLHGGFPLDDVRDVRSLLDRVRAEVAVLTPPAFDRFPNSFTHVFGGGYAAGYYGYKWAEVLSADAFDRFEREGIFNADLGHAFLVNVLETGGSRDAMASFTAFRGRAPDATALLRQSGLVEREPAPAETVPATVGAPQGSRP